ncbi:MAG: Fe-S cluster assembly ATPase SufC [bacterium]|nr:Fe-S cluster assembly ATPase SufC [bacterium]
MSKAGLEINNLTVETEGKIIVKGLSLNIAPGSIHTLMGPNGCGKSTLCLALTGHPHYTITGGNVVLNGKSLLAQNATERALSGLMLAWQHPISLPGIKISPFLRQVVNAHRVARHENPYSVSEFIQHLRRLMQQLDMKTTFAQRSVNDGLSGGEKKRLEMLMALLIEPKVLILDEIDSGLDIDAIKIVAQQLKLLAKAGTGILIITHYHRLLDYIKPDRVHVILEGQIVREGGNELALELERTSYEAISHV